MKSALLLLYRCSIESLVTLMDKCEIPDSPHKRIYRCCIMGSWSVWYQLPENSHTLIL